MSSVEHGPERDDPVLASTEAVVRAASLAMNRILDLDLDFFADGVVHDRDYDDDRLNPATCPPWSAERTIAFLEHQCGLVGRLPGIVVENHGEVFGALRALMARGVISGPLDLTHVDAHADLGLGDGGYRYLLGPMTRLPVGWRDRPLVGPEGLTDGNWLSYALACRWLGHLRYVYNRDDSYPTDLFEYVMAELDPYGDVLQIPVVPERDLERFLAADPPDPGLVTAWEPPVPLTSVPWRAFFTRMPFNLICLTRSPAFTSEAADPLLDLIRERYIDEIVL